MDESTGNLYLQDSLLKQLDIKTVKYYDVIVMATDSGLFPNSIQGSLRVKIKHSGNQPPYLEKTMFSVSVPESTKKGRQVLNVTTSDPDGGNVTLKVDGKMSSEFTFDTHTLISVKELDYEEKSFYIIKASASDDENDVPFFVHISVENVYDEAPEIKLSDVRELPEEMEVGSFISGIYKVKDNDKDDKLTFVLNGNDSAYFELDATSGQMSIAKKIDADGEDGRQMLDGLNLTVTDRGGLASSVMFNISIRDRNDNGPQCEPRVLKYSVTENTTDVIKALNCSDMDAGTNGEFSLQIMGKTIANAFTLNDSDLIVHGQNIDFETLRDNPMLISIIAVDKPDKDKAMTATVLVFVKVTTWERIYNLN
ncbi:cadherin EGF LAG seven-pass G-type receptor 1-like [Haliotis rufescens]|uniref:cadherin EGF LAG seven-pass G-type receptor 1-like n=1 Tax=Haliotis rufescens TaxID=6454 RepID=UPI00201EC75A|nr:cadherin EGF LAG seven-pass G-type receptor 1-like [Haliotis rufescens]